MLKFDFPSNTDLPPFQKIKNLEQLKQKLTTISKHIPQNLLSYKFAKTGKYLTARCKQCRASLNYVYDQQNDEYRLGKFKIIHCHDTNKKKRNTTILQMGEDIAQMKLFTHGSLRKFMMSKYGCSKSTFYRAQKIGCNPIKQNSWFDFLKNLSASVKIMYDPYPLDQSAKLPQIVMISTPSMMKSYEQYGDCVYLSLIQNTAKEIPGYSHDEHDSNNYESDDNDEDNPKSDTQKKIGKMQYLLGVFCGLSGHGKINVFGFGYFIDKSQESVLEFFRKFINIHKKAPKTIVTQNRSNIEAALQSLQNQHQFVHILDAQHFIKQLKISQKNRKDLLSLSKAQTTSQYESLQQICQQALKNDNEKSEWEKFNKLSHKICFSRIPLTFIHYPSSPSPIQKVGDIIKKRIEYAMPMVQSINLLMKLFHVVNEKSQKLCIDKNPINALSDIPILQECRQKLNKKIFNTIVTQFTRSISFHSMLDNSKQKIEYRFVREHPWKQEHTITNLGQKFHCDCRFLQKTRLPCDHLVGLLTKQGLSLLPYIGGNYLRNQNQSMKLQQSRLNNLKRQQRRIRKKLHD